MRFAIQLILRAQLNSMAKAILARAKTVLAKISLALSAFNLG